MNKVRLGLIGTGGIGQKHLEYAGELKRADYTCCCDNREAVVEATAARHGLQAFTAPEALIASGLCDAVLIATPHFFHPPIALAAMKAGLHVLVEKPMGVRASMAAKMNAEARKRKLRLAVMFQRRTDPLWQKAKTIVESGALGKLIRTCMMDSSFRTQAYYDAGGWRATWKGEGGGVMINQSPHAFDSFVWIGGMPSRVIGRALTRAHDIEVEDCAMAMLEYPDGAIGTVYTSTYEFPEIRLQQFVGERGILEIRDRSIRLGTSAPYAGEMLTRSREPWDIPLDVWTDVEVADRPHGHRFVTQNFVDAILDVVPLICPGEEGIKSLELTNAIAVSSEKGKEIALPMNAKLFDALLAKRIRESKGRKRPPGDSDRVVIPTR